MIWEAWWAWATAALLLGIAEVLAPAQILLGFAIGAGAVALLLLVGGPVAGLVSGSPALLLLAFAGVSAVAWLVLRRTLKGAAGPVKRWERDINDD